MKTKNLIVLLIILIVVIAVGAVFLFASKPNIITVQDKQINDSTKPFVVKIAYPYIPGLDGFNQKVYEAVNKEISDFKTNSLENDAAVKQVDPADYAKYPREYDLDIGYDKGEIDNNVASVILNVYNFEGGAHGASYFVPINYNPKTKAEIKLADLFPGKPDYLKTISDFSIKNLTKQIDSQMLDNSWLNTGAGPTADNYSVFLINKNDITFYFQQYQVAAGAAGSFKVTFPK